MGPPEASISLSFPSEKKPIERLSGDQNGNRPPSVPASAAAAPVRSDWSQSFPPAPKTARSPSGESAIGADSSPVIWNVEDSGAMRNEWIARGALHLIGRRSLARKSAANSAAPAAAQPIQPRRPRLPVGALLPARETSAIQRSSLPRSPADCQRSSGSLARQVLTTRSNPGGDSGWTVEIGAGSLDMIAVISEAWLVPAKAFRPVAIS